MILFATGLLAGSLHVVTGPDHLAALAPLAVDDTKRAARVGAIWGLGHGLGVCAVGSIGIFAAQALDVNLVSSWSEFLVGLVLVLVGVWAIHRSMGVTVHVHDHAHDAGDDHEHFHVHTGKVHTHGHHQHAVFGVGALHGAAGTGHLFGVIPAMALGPADAAVYLVAYLMAAVVSMSLFGGLLGRVVARGGQALVRHLMLGSGGLAVSLGLLWAWTGLPL